MKQNRDHILTSHAGSLPRPDDVIEANRARESGQASDERRFQAQLHSGVADVVRRQKDLGITIPGDGEFGKSMGHRVNYGAWWSYSFQLLGGLELGTTGLYDLPPQRSRPGEIVLTSFADRRDRVKFAAAYGDPDSGITTGPRATLWPVCVDKLIYTGHAAIKSDIANFKAALQAAGLEEGFMTSIAPGSASRIANRYYKTEEEFLFACADAMREEYKAIVDAGLVLQLDDPAIAENWDMVNPRTRGGRLQEVLDGPCGGAQPRDPRPAGGPDPVASRLGQLARPPHHRHCHARHRRRHAGRQVPCLLVRGRQRPPRARVEGVAGREAARPQADPAGRREPRHQRGRTPRARGRTHHALRRPRGEGARHRLPRLRSRRPRAPPHRPGGAGIARARGGIGDAAVVAVRGARAVRGWHGHRATIAA